MPSCRNKQTREQSSLDGLHRNDEAAQAEKKTSVQSSWFQVIVLLVHSFICFPQKQPFLPLNKLPLFSSVLSRRVRRSKGTTRMSVVCERSSCPLLTCVDCMYSDALHAYLLRQEQEQDVCCWTNEIHHQAQTQIVSASVLCMFILSFLPIISSPWCPSLIWPQTYRLFAVSCLTMFTVWKIKQFDLLLN